MTFEESIVGIIEAWTPLDSLIDGRIQVRLREGQEYPAIRYIGPISGSDVQYRHHDGGTDLVDHRYQFECYADSKIEVGSLATELKRLWNGYRNLGEGIGGAYIAAETRAEYIDGPDYWRQIIDVMFTHKRD
jgi:hypothetical protein